jgi:hypothetical protein
MLSYATSPDSPAPLPVPAASLTVRIGEKNDASMRLFEKLGFMITKRVEVFEEVELRWRAGDGEQAHLPWILGRRIDLVV